MRAVRSSVCHGRIALRSARVLVPPVVALVAILGALCPARAADVSLDPGVSAFAVYYAERIGVPVDAVQDTAADMVDTYVDLFDLPEEEAETEAILDMMAGDMRVAAFESLSHVFAGSWINRDPHTITFAFTEDPDEHLFELAESIGFEQPDRLVAVRAGTTLGNLEALQARIMTEGEALYPYEPSDAYSGFQSSIDEIAGQVVVFGPEPNRYADDLGAIVDTPLVRLEQRDLSLPLCSQTNCDPSIFGGLGTSNCSTGYTLVKAGSKATAITTAAHCSGIQSHGGEDFWGSEPLFEQQSGQLDTEIWSLLERFWVPKDDVWESTSTNRDIASVTNYYALTLGDPVWKVGKQTGKTAGVITENHMSFAPDIPGSSTGFRATADVDHGDSGGPVYFGGLAYGTVYGGSGGANPPFDTLFLAASFWDGAIGWSIAAQPLATPTFDWYLKNSHSGGSADTEWQHGSTGSIAIAGDWNGDGKDQPGTYTASSGKWDLHGEQIFTYGTGSSNLPFTGDWDDDGIDEAGYYAPSTQRFYRQGISGSILYGNPGDKPISGDWDGDGDDDIGVWRPSSATFYLRDSDNGATTSLSYGNPSDTPLAGDWDGGAEEIGVYRSSTQTFYLRKSNGTTLTIGYGNPGDTPIVGDWDGQGSAYDTIAVIR